jgi:hypothetical protein
VIESSDGGKPRRLLVLLTSGRCLVVTFYNACSACLTRKMFPAQAIRTGDERPCARRDCELAGQRQCWLLMHTLRCYLACPMYIHRTPFRLQHQLLSRPTTFLPSGANRPRTPPTVPCLTMILLGGLERAFSGFCGDSLQRTEKVQKSS